MLRAVSASGNILYSHKGWLAQIWRDQDSLAPQGGLRIQTAS